MASIIVDDPDERMKNKPSGSAFKQQKLPAWQPILTAGTVLPTFFLIGIAFIPIGFGLLMSSNQVKEKQIDYTLCKSIDPVDKGEPCSEVLEKRLRRSCQCEVSFDLDVDFDRDVFIYYSLTNYYQNHRRYVKSRDDKQLLGFVGAPSSDCEPFAYNKVGSGQKRPIAPCGAIANSLFNDTFTLKRFDQSRNNGQGADSIVKTVRTGIAWATDKNAKFKNPGGANLKDAFKGYTRPPNWDKDVWDLDSNNPDNNGYLNDALIVWMRTAALPTFRKLYARVDHASEGPYHNSLPKGKYKVHIDYTYPVSSFKGTKRLIISNTSWLGGKNPFLGVAYIIVGFICLLLSGLFFIIHRKFGKSTSDLLNINQRTPYLTPQ